jgi:hypothetical protein
VYAQVPFDDRYLYYAKSEFNTGVWRVPVGGGEETEIVRGPIPHAYGWALTPTSVLYTTATSRARGEEYTIRSFHLATGRTTELFRKAGPFGHNFLAVSPDEAWILFVEGGLTESELTLVDGFR